MKTVEEVKAEARVVFLKTAITLMDEAFSQLLNATVMAEGQALKAGDYGLAQELYEVRGKTADLYAKLKADQQMEKKK